VKLQLETSFHPKNLVDIKSSSNSRQCINPMKTKRLTKRSFDIKKEVVDESDSGISVDKLDWEDSKDKVIKRETVTSNKLEKTSVSEDIEVKTPTFNSQLNSQKKVLPLKISKNFDDGSYKVKNSSPMCLSCDVCGKQFPLGGQWKFKRHMETVHATESNFFCDIENCTKNFRQKSSLAAHKEAHKHKHPWQCNSCKSTFRDLTDLVSHVKTIHGEEDVHVAKSRLSTNRVSSS